MSGLERLTRAADFRSCYERGRVWKNRLAVLHLLPAADGVTRVGLAVSKKLGKAVVRNRVKRLLREAVRRRAGALQDGLHVVLAARMAARTARYADVVRAVDDLLARGHVLRTSAGSEGQERSQQGEVQT